VRVGGGVGGALGTDYTRAIAEVEASAAVAGRRALSAARRCRYRLVWGMGHTTQHHTDHTTPLHFAYEAVRAFVSI
jgi:hypothetical protein